MSSRRGGERVLESRHLIGLFLGVVLLCCVFFTLGYVMGTTQYGNTPVQAASLNSAPKPLPQAAKPAAQPSTSTEWDFYTDKKTSDIPLKPAREVDASTARPNRDFNSREPASNRKAPSRSPAPSPSRRLSAESRSRRVAVVPPRYRAPRMSRSAIVLQIGALRQESDALAMANVLQRRGFPAFILPPSNDSFYRVQVGPFPNQAVGEKAKKSLLREGFKAIYRR